MQTHSPSSLPARAVRALLATALCLPLFAAEPVDLIVSAGTIVTQNARREVIRDGAIAVKNGRIVALGSRTKIDFLYTAKQRLDRPDAILAPGLINTHAHAAMSLLRGLADDKTLQDWLTAYIFPAEKKNVTSEFVRAGTRLAVLEMMLGGTTTYVDMYYFEDHVAQVTRDAGMRAVLGETIIGFPVPDNETPQRALAFTERFIKEFKDDKLITPAVAPHALYTNSAETLQAARALADKVIKEGGGRGGGGAAQEGGGGGREEMRKDGGGDCLCVCVCMRGGEGGRIQYTRTCTIAPHITAKISRSSTF